jgi:hypothetical protein
MGKCDVKLRVGDRLHRAGNSGIWTENRGQGIRDSGKVAVNRVQVAGNKVEVTEIEETEDGGWGYSIHMSQRWAVR